MTDLITEARALCKKATPGPWMGLRAAYEDCLLIKCDEDEYLMSQHDVAFVSRSRTLVEKLCDALERAHEQNKHLMHEVCRLACESVEREKTLARLEAEVIEACNSVRWVPVTEHLPTERGYYLAVVKRIAPDDLGGNNTRVKIMRWLGEDWRYPVHIPEWINEAITETVTHWQPLPAAPDAE